MLFQKRTILDRDAYGFPQARFVNPEFRSIQAEFSRNQIRHEFLLTVTARILGFPLDPVHKAGINCG